MLLDLRSLEEATGSVSLTADAGTFALAGQAALFKITAVETVGTFSLAGVSAAFVVTMPASLGTFALGGIASTFNVTLTASVGAFALAGQASAAIVTLTAGTGAFALAGIDAVLTATGGTAMAADAGAFVLNGVDAALSATGQEVVSPGGGAGGITRRQWRALRQEQHRAKVVERKDQKRRARPKVFRLYAESALLSLVGGGAAAATKLVTLGPHACVVTGNEAAAALAMPAHAGAYGAAGKRASLMHYEALYVEDEPPPVDDTVVINITPRYRRLSRREQIRMRRAA